MLVAVAVVAMVVVATSKQKQKQTKDHQATWAVQAPRVTKER